MKNQLLEKNNINEVLSKIQEEDVSLISVDLGLAIIKDLDQDGRTKLSHILMEFAKPYGLRLLNPNQEGSTIFDRDTHLIFIDMLPFHKFINILKEHATDISRIFITTF